METTTEVPAFKLAKVGEKKEKKRSGVAAWLGMPRPGNPGVLALGKTGAVKVLAVFFMAGAFASGAYNIYKSTTKAMARNSKSASAKPKPFERPKYDETEVAKAPKTQERAQDSLSMIAGGASPNSAKSPDQQAADAAAKADAAPPAEKEPPTPDASKAAPSGPAGGIDPAAMAAAAAGANPADKSAPAGKGPFSSRFGAMSSGLSGGAGMSGGVGAAFGGPKLGERLGAVSGFKNPTPASRVAASKVRSTPSAARGLASKQLNAAFRQSGTAKNSTGETSSMYASSAFENNPGSGQLITGAGMGDGGVTTADAPPGGSDSSGGGGGSGPTETGTYGDGGTTQDDCVAELGPDYMNTPAGGCYKPIDNPADVSPWKDNIVRLQWALGLAIGCLLLAYLIGKAAKGTVGQWVAFAFACAAIAFAAWAAIEAVVIMNMEGGQMTGGVSAVVAGIVLAMAAMTAAGAADGANQASTGATNATTTAQATVAPGGTPPATTTPPAGAPAGGGGGGC